MDPQIWYDTEQKKFIAYGPAMEKDVLTKDTIIQLENNMRDQIEQAMCANQYLPNDKITSFTISSPGSGYTASPATTFTRPKMSPPIQDDGFTF